MKREKVWGRLGAVLTVLAGLSLSACGGSVTVFASSWRPPKAEPLRFRGQPVVAVVMTENLSVRRNAEDVMAREITHYGAKGLPMYTLMADSPVENEKAAKAAVEKAGVTGVVVLRPMGMKTTSETHTYSSPMYGSYWGGYYGHGWGGMGGYGMGGYGMGGYGYGMSTWGAIPDYGSPHGAVPTAAPVYYGGMPSTTQTYTTTTKVLQVEVVIFSLKQNSLVFAGVSETSEPGKKVDEFVMQLAAATIKELGAQGLISN
jgi:hypothetical protein